MPTVVIVGGGHAGRAVAEGLKKKLDVIILSGENFVEFGWAAPEVVAQVVSHAEVTSIDPAKFEIKDVRHVYGVAKRVVDEKTLAFAPLDAADTEVNLTFDFLVCATGFAMPSLLAEPGNTLSARKHYLGELHAALAAADSVIVAGGGPVGVELAGCLAAAADGKKKITLVSSSAALLPSESQSYGSVALAELRRLGVHVECGDRITGAGSAAILAKGASYQLESSGKTLLADVYLPAISAGPRTSWLREGAFASCIDSASGKVVVDPSTLRSIACPSLFAVGAPSSANPFANIVPILFEVKVVVHNVTALACAPQQTPTTPQPKLAKLKPPPIRGQMYIRVRPGYAFLIPENDPCFGPCIKCCGFPCILCCPCFACALCKCAGKLHPLTCGFCCEAVPAGKGPAYSLEHLLLEKSFKSKVKGVGESAAPEGVTMQR